MSLLLGRMGARMRDFSWMYFTNTGDIDAYMLYKEIDADHEQWTLEEEERQLEEDLHYSETI